MSMKNSRHDNIPTERIQEQYYNKYTYELKKKQIIINIYI